MTMEAAIDVKDEQEQKGGLSLTPTERTKVGENHRAMKAASMLGLNEEEIAFGIEFTCGAWMGNQQKSYKAAFPEATDNYASARSSDLMKRERVLTYIKRISVALMERLIVEARGVERLEDWRNDPKCRARERHSRM